MVCLVDTGRRRRKNMCDEIVIVFRAQNQEQAIVRSLQIGRSHEHEYLNGKGQRVRWKLARVLNLDRVGKRVDGQEVASQLGWHETEEPLAFSHVFNPEEEPPALGFV